MCVGEKKKSSRLKSIVTRAAFLASLGANLRITDDDLHNPSPLNTPSLRPYDLGALPISYSYLASMSASTDDLAKVEDHELTTSPESEAAPNDPLAGIPELTTFTAESEDDKVAALKLIADSVAQQRQTASSILIFNPVNLAVLAVVLAIAAQLTKAGHAGVWRVFTTWIGLVMAYLVAIRMFTKGYLDLAEQINWNWLDEDRLLVTRFGDEIIGALVLGWTPGDKKGSRRAKVGRGLIRGWTVRLKYRGKGVGTGLLEEAVQIVNEKGGDGIDFAEEHASAYSWATTAAIADTDIRLQMPSESSSRSTTIPLTSETPVLRMCSIPWSRSKQTS